MKKSYLHIGAFVAYMLGALMFAQPAPAVAGTPIPLDCGTSGYADPLGLECVQHTGLSKTDPRVVVGRIIKVVLGLLGTLFVVLTLYAGFTWMTSGGNEEQVTKARKILTTAVIGLIIILASYSITNFVLRSICEAAATDGKPCAF